MRNSSIAYFAAILFLLVLTFSKDPISVARAWVIWPIFLATALICRTIEENKQ
jgi:hypothetical protein